MRVIILLLIVITISTFIPTKNSNRKDLLEYGKNEVV